MGKPLKLLILALLYLLPLQARQRLEGFCEQGGQKVTVQGIPSTTFVQASYPRCTVTVYITGGGGKLATIYSDNNNTSLANPFTASSVGLWYFYADNGEYDVTLSGGGLPAPWTLGDQTLGSGSSSLSLLAVNYNFTPQAPGGTLQSGVGAVVTLTPCPLGVFGSSKEPVYVSNGTGTAESVLPLGGTCTSGAASGTIQFIPANNHSGPWTISSVFGGVPEAINVGEAAGGATVVMPAGNLPSNGTSYLQPGITVVGQGPGASLIVPGSCSELIFGVANLNPQPPPSGYGYQAYSPMKLQDFMMDGSSCNGINTLTGFGEYVGSDTTSTSLLFGLRIENVYFNNVAQSIHCERCWDAVVNHVRTFANSRIWFTDTTGGLGAPNHSSLVKILDTNYSSICITSTQCDAASMTVPAVELDACAECIVDGGEYGGAGPSDTSNVGLSITGDSENVVLNNLTFESFGTEIDVAPNTYPGGQAWPSYGVINNCALDGMRGIGLKFEDGTFPYSFRRAGNWTIANSGFTSGWAADAVYIGQWSQAMSISNSTFNCAASQNCLHITAYTSGTVVNGNTFGPSSDYPVTATGILVDGVAASHTITNNVFQFQGTAPYVDNSAPNANTVVCGNQPTQVIPQTCTVSQLFSVEKIGNSAIFQNDTTLVTCANANGCWATQNYANPLTNVAVATSQTITLIPTLGTTIGAFVEAARIKNISYGGGVSSCQSGGNMTASVGTLTSSAFFIPAFNIQQNTGASVFAPTNGVLANYGSTAAQDGVTVTFATTGGATLDQVTAGCQVYIWLTYQILPRGQF